MGPCRVGREQGVEHVADRADPADERDLLARRAGRVAAPVPVLVMGQRDCSASCTSCDCEPRGSGADRGVGLHRLPLFGRRAGPACAGCGRGCRSCRRRASRSRAAAAPPRRHSCRSRAPAGRRSVRCARCARPVSASRDSAAWPRRLQISSWVSRSSPVRSRTPPRAARCRRAARRRTRFRQIDSRRSVPTVPTSSAAKRA